MTFTSPYKHVRMQSCTSVQTNHIHIHANIQMYMMNTNTLTYSVIQMFMHPLSYRHLQPSKHTCMQTTTIQVNTNIQTPMYTCTIMWLAYTSTQHTTTPELIKTTSISCHHTCLQIGQNLGTSVTMHVLCPDKYIWYNVLYPPWEHSIQIFHSTERCHQMKKKKLRTSWHPRISVRGIACVMFLGGHNHISQNPSVQHRRLGWSYNLVSLASLPIYRTPDKSLLLFSAIGWRQRKCTCNARTSLFCCRHHIGAPASATLSPPCGTSSLGCNCGKNKQNLSARGHKCYLPYFTNTQNIEKLFNLLKIICHIGTKNNQYQWQYNTLRTECFWE